MRELKFRIYDKTGKIKLLEGIWNMPDSSYDFDKIMQFTGLKDKNGKDIYEGDLLSPADRDNNFGAFEVFYHDGDEASCHVGFQMNRVHWQGAACGGMIPNFLPRTASTYEVIGNIYENEDLLTKSK